MSLRAFHIVFIIASCFLAAGFGVWAFPRNVIWALSAFAMSGLIFTYLVWFIVKSRTLKRS